jgi:hypothetical protein
MFVTSFCVGCRIGIPFESEWNVMPAQHMNFCEAVSGG